MNCTWMKWNEKRRVFFCDNRISIRLKVRLNKETTKLATLYMSERWVVNKKIERKIRVTVTRILTEFIRKNKATNECRR